MPGSLQREILQKRPFPSRQSEAVVGLLRTADVVRRGLGRLVESRGLTLQQYNVLRILRGAGREGLPTLEIAARMIEQAPGVTRLMDRLLAKGMVRRWRCPRDRRQVLCRIAPAGRRLLRDLDQPMEGAGRRALRALGAREVDMLVRALDAVRAAHEGTGAPSRRPPVSRGDRRRE